MRKIHILFIIISIIAFKARAELRYVDDKEASTVKGGFCLPLCHSTCITSPTTFCLIKPPGWDPCTSFYNLGTCAFTMVATFDGTLAACVAVPKYHGCENNSAKYKDCSYSQNLADICYRECGPAAIACGKQTENVCHRPSMAEIDARSCTKDCKVISLQSDCAKECK